MKKYKVQIYTDEYSVDVYIGSPKELDTHLKRTLNPKDYDKYPFDGKQHRGRAFNCLPKHNPFIVIDGDLGYFEAMGTLAHEASHAMDYISEFIGVDDVSGEFKAGGIGAIVRGVTKKDFK